MKQLTLDEYFPEEEKELSNINWEQVNNVLRPLHFRVKKGASLSGHHYRKDGIVRPYPESNIRMHEGELSYNSLEQLSDGSMPDRIYFDDLIPESLTREFIRLVTPFLQQRARKYSTKLNYLEAMYAKCPENPNEPLNLEDIRIEAAIKRMTDKPGITMAERIRIIKNLMKSPSEQPNEELAGERVIINPWSGNTITIGATQTETMRELQLESAAELSEVDNRAEDRDPNLPF